MNDLDQIPPLRGPCPEGARAVRRRVPAATAPGVGRRSLLGGALAAGTTAGLAALGVFPPAREALAAGFGLRTGYYDIYRRCPAYAGWHNCSPGCGPSTVVPGACRTSGRHRGFHRSGVSDPGRYRLRPNQCFAGRYDGWIWHYGHRCGRCRRSITYRCHDGWKKSRYGHWYKSVCRTIIGCAR